jgi:protein-serine/threonine kinase
MDFKKLRLMYHGHQGSIQLVEKDGLKYILKTMSRRFFPKNSNMELLGQKLKSLSHDNIITFYDVSWNNKVQKFEQLLEYADCGDFFDNFYRFTTKQRLELFLQALYAIHYLHERGIAHRDLKMENMVLTDNFTKLKLIDFDYCSLTDHGKSMAGTILYIPPEHYVKDYLQNHDTIRTYIEQDLWACGIILYQVITDCTPWSFEEYLPHENLHYKHYLKTNTFYEHEEMLGEMKFIIKQLLQANPSARPPLKYIIPLYREILRNWT